MKRILGFAALYLAAELYVRHREHRKFDEAMRHFTRTMELVK